jgi:hypothetical protein
MRSVERFADAKGLNDDLDLLKRGALVAQSPARFNEIPELSEEEKHVLGHEAGHKWSHPFLSEWRECSHSFQGCSFLISS